MLQKRQFHIQLKTQETNNKLTQKLVQGSNDTELVCSFDQDGKIIKIADTAKISLAVIYNGNTANYHLEPGDQDYGIVINAVDGTVSIPFTEMLTTAFGVNKLFLKIDDTNISYAIGLEYEVIKNDAYNPQSTPNNLPSYKKLEKELDLKLNKDFSNSDDVALKAKLSSIGVSEDDTPEQLRDKLQTLKADNRLDNSAVKNSLSNDLADVDLDKLDEKFQATDSGKQQKINSQTIALKANADFSNVSNDDFDRILVQTDMGKQILDNTKQVQTKLDTDMGNVNTLLFSREMKLTGAYQDLAKRPSGQGRTADEIKSLFEANRFEEQAAVDFSNPKFASTTLYMAYQFTSNNQTIIQELPAVVDNKIIMVEALLSSGKTNPTLTFTPKAGDNIQGLTSPFTISGKDSYLGYFIPLQNENAWQFIPHEISHEFSLAVSDDKGNVHIGINSVQFKKATVTENGGILEVEPDAQTGGTSNTTFTDFEGRTFTSNKMQSMDKSLRISNLGGIADISKGMSEHNEGIHACLGNDQLINSKYGRAKLYFGDIRVKGGSSVYEDKDTKSYVVQDTDPQDDPNISGGTTFICGLYYEPTTATQNTVTQDGAIRLELVDDTDTPITGNDGNPIAVQIDYKAGDTIKPEFYVGEFQAKAFTRVHLKIEPVFANEEVIPVGANTQICLQSITKDESSGLALLSFMAFTGYKIGFDTLYYGFNSLNLARFLVFDQPQETVSGEMPLGDNTFINFATNSEVQVSGYNLIIENTGLELPVWNIYKVYSEYDCQNIGGKNALVTVTLTDKDNAFDVSLLEYTGTQPAPQPKLLSYNNTVPVFAAGWSVIDTMFISEDVVSGEHKQSKTFTLPTNAKGLAISLYPNNSQSPTTLKLKDFEADITPWFNRVMITDNSHISEQYLRNLDYVYRSIVAVPAGYASYRYTINSAKTKLPVGVFSGGDNKIVNDNSWTDAGSTDPNKTQGDIKFLADGIVTINYQAQCYNEQGTINNVEFWLEKVSDSSEVAGSHYATTIEAQRTTPKNITSPKFTFSVKANETYRFYGKSNKDDGFYLQTSTVANPLIRFDYEFEELSEVIKLALDDAFSKTNEIKFVKADGEEVTNKILVYNVDDGKFKLEDKA